MFSLCFISLIATIPVGGSEGKDGGGGGTQNFTLQTLIKSQQIYAIDLLAYEESR